MVSQKNFKKILMNLQMNIEACLKLEHAIVMNNLKFVQKNKLLNTQLLKFTHQFQYHLLMLKAKLLLKAL